ncbi:MAG: hypothetical protein ACTSYJ_00915 [Candidatus Thorarchaeota archaeon]
MGTSKARKMCFQVELNDFIKHRWKLVALLLSITMRKRFENNNEKPSSLLLFKGKQRITWKNCN